MRHPPQKYRGGLGQQNWNNDWIGDGFYQPAYETEDQDYYDTLELLAEASALSKSNNVSDLLEAVSSLEAACNIISTMPDNSWLLGRAKRIEMRLEEAFTHDPSTIYSE